MKRGSEIEYLKIKPCHGGCASVPQYGLFDGDYIIAGPGSRQTVSRTYQEMLRAHRESTGCHRMQLQEAYTTG